MQQPEVSLHCALPYALFALGMVKHRMQSICIYSIKFKHSTTLRLPMPHLTFTKLTLSFPKDCTFPFQLSIGNKPLCMLDLNLCLENARRYLFALMETGIALTS